jgi:hypothetical protein
MRIFICDKCNTQFPQPLDEEMYKDVNGNVHILDLCAPCRKDLKDKKEKPNKDFFENILKEKNK